MDDGSELARIPADKKPDDDLLSHGETPHYHRRRAVSLLSSGWDQVVPARYGRQTNRCHALLGVPAFVGQGHGERVDVADVRLGGDCPGHEG